MLFNILVNRFNRFILIFLISLIIFNCAKVDPVTGEKILIEPNEKVKAREAANKDGGLLGDILGNKNKQTNFEFSTSNVLWRATLKNLDFLPLVNADYSGGVIIYDWYSDKNEKQLIKISVRFLNSELKSTSVVVSGHKKICNDLNRCSIEKLDDKFSNEIRESIITTARQIKIEDTKKESQK